MRGLSSIRALGIAVAILHVAPPDAMAADDLMRMVPQGQAMTPRPATDAALVDLARDGIPLLGGAAEVLAHVEQQPALATRGAREERIYQTISPAVVLVLVYEGDEEKGLGSGSVIADGQVLTSWHVVADAQRVAIVFKPAAEGQAPTRADFVPVKVVKVDEVSDLALLEYPKGVKPLKAIQLGEAGEIAVGADVNAIGHPIGETWTYTRGVISQFRKNYRWDDGSVRHEADVIQTQTPISPGNSGGPLLSDLGHLVGVNAFKSTEEDAEGLNFAVSVLDVKKFMAEQTGRVAERSRRVAQKKDEPPPCQPHLYYSGRNKANNADIRVADLFCQGQANAMWIYPDDVHESWCLWVDTASTGDPDLFIYDFDHDQKWDYSLIASHHDGKIDLIGYHPDGKAWPSRVERFTGQPTPWAKPPPATK